MTRSSPRDRLFRDRLFTSKLWRLALPIALQNLMLAAVAAADALMLGSFDQDAMSAVSQATQIQFVQNMALYASTSALIILGAQYWGKGEVNTLSRLFFMAMRFCGVISAAVFVGCVFFPRYLMMLFTDQPILIGLGADYLRLAGWSYLLTAVSQCYLALMKISEHTKATALISSGAVILNIGLNAIFIFGLCGVPAMGVRGAALATLLSRIAELLVSVLLSLKKGYIFPHWGEFFHRDRELKRSFDRCLYPVLGASMTWGIGFTSYTSFMGHIDRDASAANSIVAVVRDLVCSLCNGLASGGGILVGNELGCGDLEKGKLYGIRICKLSYLCGFLSTAIILALTPGVLAFVKLTPTARTYLWQLMIITSFYMIGRVVNTVVINGIFYAGGDTVFDLYSLGVTMWGLAVPLAALGTFVFHWPVAVVFAMTCLDEVGKIPWVMIHFRRYKWVKNLTLEPNEKKEISHDFD